MPSHLQTKGSLCAWAYPSVSCRIWGTAVGFVTTGQWQRPFFVHSLPQAHSESTEEREKASKDSEAIC